MRTLTDISPAASPISTSLTRQVLLVALVYTFGFVVLASALLVQYGFPLDDSYIHQTVARNFATYDIPGFIPGERSSGTTSILWTCIQAANYAFLHAIDPVIYNFALSWVTLVIIGNLLFAIAQRDKLPQWQCWLLALTPALCGNFVWLGLIGMEHLLFVALSLAAIYFWFDDGAARARSARLAGLAAGLIAATRPEAMIFAPLLVVVGPRSRRRLADCLTLGVFWAVAVVVVFGVNLYTSHSLIPATMKGRSWLYFQTSGGPHTLLSVERFVGSWIQRLPRQFSTDFVERLDSLRQFDTGFALFGFLLAAIALAGAYALLRRRLPRVRCLLLWAVLHFCIYMVTFPSGGHGGRYQPLNLLLFFPLLCLGLVWIFERIAPAGAKWPRIAVVSLMLIGGGASLATWRTVTIDGIEHINDTHGMIGNWMVEHLPPDARVAAFDIGRVSYEWPHAVVDLGGLADPAYAEYLISGQVPKYVRQHDIQYVVLVDDTIAGFGFTTDPSIQVKLLTSYCTPTKTWLVGYRYTIHAERCQKLYQLSYLTTQGQQAAQ